jgi:class 3 adenylate cyclase
VRRLATIMFTDIVGYSAMMERDERGTLELLSQHNAIVQAQVQQYGGTVIKTIGDAFLIDFNSVVEAVECAFTIQEACVQFNASRGENQPKLLLRIGVHVGDVVFQENDVFGDGVNVASRIQTQAEPGSICISEEVYKLIEKKVPISFRLIGEKKLKNIERPMRVYVSGNADVPAAKGIVGGSGAKSNAMALLTGVGLGLILIAGIIVYYYMSHQAAPSQRPAAAAAPVANAAPIPAPPAQPAPPAEPDADAAAQYIRKQFFSDLAADFPQREVLQIKAFKPRLKKLEKDRYRIEADVPVEQTQDLFVATDFLAAVRDAGFNADSYKKALAEADQRYPDLAASVPKEDHPTLVKRTTGKGYDLTVPVELTAALEGGAWVFGPLSRRVDGRQGESLKGQPLASFGKNALIAGSEPAMQAINSYIQQRESFAARVVVKQTQAQVRRDEEESTRKAAELAALRKGFTVGEMYEGSMIKDGNATYQVILMIIDNRNDGEDLAVTLALTGEGGILKQLRGRLETEEAAGKIQMTANLASVANTGIAPQDGVPDFFEKGKTYRIVLKQNGERLEGASGPYALRLNRSRE